MSSINKRKDGCYIFQTYYKDPASKSTVRYQKNLGNLEKNWASEIEGEEVTEDRLELEIFIQENKIKEAGGLPISPRLSKAVKKYISTREMQVESGERSYNTLRTDRSSLKLFREFIEDSCKDLRINKIKRSHIQNWIDFRRRNKISQSTININLRTVKSFFSFELEEGRISEHPFKGITISETELNKDDSVIDFFEQIRKFILEEMKKRENGPSEPRQNQINNKKTGLDWFDDNNWLIHYIWIMLNTGMRSGEISNLKWRIGDEDSGALRSRSFSHLSSNESTIDIYFKKRRRTIPVTDAVERSLTMHRQYKRDTNIDTTYLLENPRTQKPYTTSAAANLFKKLVSDLEIDAKHTLHSLRHGYISKLVSKGGNIIMISKTVGHSSSEFTQKRYMHLRAKEDLTDTMNLISDDD